MNAKENIAKIKSNVLNSEVAVKIIRNSSWMVGDKVFTMIIGVFVTAIVCSNCADNLPSVVTTVQPSSRVTVVCFP